MDPFAIWMMVFVLLGGTGLFWPMTAFLLSLSLCVLTELIANRVTADKAA